MTTKIAANGIEMNYRFDGPADAPVTTQEEPTVWGAPEENKGLPDTPLGTTKASKKLVGQLTVIF